MHHRHFIAQIDEPKILAAIRDAELRTSGEIRVFVSHHQITDPQVAAARQFRRLGMQKTKKRGAILIFIAPKSRNFALFGDVLTHEKCGPEFWKTLRDELIPLLKAGQYTPSLLHAITRAATLLTTHFPKQ